MPKPTKQQTNSVPEHARLPTEKIADTLYARATDALEKKGQGPALAYLEGVFSVEPLHVPSLMLHARIMAQLERFGRAIASMQLALDIQPEQYQASFMMSQWLAKQGRFRQATAIMHRCEKLEPHTESAKHYLSGLYGTLGHEQQSRYWATRTALIKPISTVKAKSGQRLSIIVLNTVASGSLQINQKKMQINVTEGHNNLASALDKAHITQHSFRIDCLNEEPELLKQLPSADLVYNSITDPERCEHALHLAQQVCDNLQLPVINEPRAVLAASREGNYQRFKNHADIIVPKSIKLEGVRGDVKPSISLAVKEHGFRYPILVRVSGYQNGKYMHRIYDLETHDLSEINELTKLKPETLYVIQYEDVGIHDARAPDHPLYPKYRAFFVGERLYPTHVRYGYGDWNVHMPQSAPTYRKFPWLYDWARDYLENPLSHFTDRQWTALTEAMASLQMEYVGVDFALSTTPGHEDKVVIFEANASMRTFLLDTFAFVPEHDAAKKAIVAVHEAFTKKANMREWRFKLPRGKTSAGEQWTKEADDAAAFEWHFNGDGFNSGLGDWLWHACYKHLVKADIALSSGSVVHATVCGPKQGVDALRKAIEDVWGGKGIALVSKPASAPSPTSVRFTWRDDG